MQAIKQHNRIRTEDKRTEARRTFLGCFSLLLICGITIWLFMYRDLIWKEQADILSLIISKRVVFGLIIITVLSFLFSMANARTDLKALLFKYRYWVAGAALIFCVIFEISGSSIGVWSNYLGVEDQGVLLGVSRGIRSDEWAVTVPIIKSQYFVQSGRFSYISDVVRAAPTDMFSVAVIAPVWFILGIFKPFNLGYLFLPFSKGLAFGWSFKMISLFMVSFEFGRMITKDKRLLALMYAAIILFAPAVQWWSGGVADILIAAELATLMLEKYIRTDSYKKRWLYAGAIFWCAGMFFFQLYPAWQVPMFYILIAVTAWIFISGWKSFRKTYKDLIILGVTIILTGAMIAIFLYSSQDAIKSVMNTVYPGARDTRGGGYPREYIFNYITNIWYAFSGESNITNVCESAQFMHFFPLSMILPIAAMIRQRKKDLLSICLLAVCVFLYIYIFIGFPEILAKISLLNMSVNERAIVLWELTNVLLLVRGLSLWSEEKALASRRYLITSRIISLLLAAVFAGFTVYTVYHLSPGYFRTWMLIVSVIALFVTAAMVLLSTNRKAMNAAAWSIVLFSIFTGSLINPVRSGITFFDKSDTIAMMREMEEEDGGAVWIIDNMSYPYSNMGLLEGLNTINSTNPYPDLERWHLIDPEGDYEEIYNRYANMDLVLSNENRFELVGPDYIRVYLSEEGLKTLGVDYILTNREIEGYERIKTSSLASVYKVKK